MAYVCQFGWPGDDGLGERLIQRILAGVKTATCAPLVGYDDAELALVKGAEGTVVDVTDGNGIVRTQIRLLKVYETPFGAPTEALLAGEGFPGDPEGFQATHRRAWAGYMGELGQPLTDETLLLVEEFELAAPVAPQVPGLGAMRYE